MNITSRHSYSNYSHHNGIYRSLFEVCVCLFVFFVCFCLFVCFLFVCLFVFSSRNIRLNFFKHFNIDLRPNGHCWPSVDKHRKTKKIDYELNFMAGNYNICNDLTRSGTCNETKPDKYI